MVTLLFPPLATAQESDAALTYDHAEVSEKIDELRDATPARAARLEQEILWAWERSGSDAMDLLYERGRAALAAGQVSAAIDHFTALIDHAPSYPQGYDGRAQAYLASGLFGPAIHDIGQLLTHEPRHFLGLARLAQVLEQTGDLARAYDVITTLEGVHPNFDQLSAWKARLELAQTGPAL